MTFFDRYPLFRETSTTGSTADRLNLRHQAIIEWNRDILKGKTVLDIASHDGRWSFAALDVGAAHVLGIEARPHLVENAAKTFRDYGAKDDTFEFRTADVFEALRRDTPQVDVVMLLGFMYHVSNHTELVKLVAQTNAKHVIVDTQVVPEDRLHRKEPNVIALEMDFVAKEGAQAVPDVEGSKSSVVGSPSRGAVRFLFDAFGYDTEEFDWKALIAGQEREHKDVWHYQRGTRATFRMTKRA